MLRTRDVLLDRRSGRVLRSGVPLALEPRTFDLLVYLMARPGELVTHAELLDAIWSDAAVTPHSLTQAVSQLRRALDDEARTATFIQTVHRRGYRWVAPVSVDETASVAPGGRPDGVALRRLPARAGPLVGRDDLVERVARELRHVRLLTLVGPGGVGKTQLALEAGRQAETAFQEGALFVDLAVETNAGVEHAVLRALRVVPAEGMSALDALAGALRDRSLLLMLDNCEHVAAACGTLATCVIGGAPRVHVLATTQQPLRVPGEVLVRVPPLAVPSAEWASSAGPGREGWPGSVSLFVDRARAANPDFDLTAANAASVADICRRLDGIPLALELAAARANVLTPAQIAGRLDERLQLLASPREAVPPRHQTLAATVEWSVGLLPDRARWVLAQLAVFSGGWTLDAAQFVVGADLTLIDDLATLVDRSLVTVDVDRLDARYRLLETIRLYAQQRLAESSESDAVRDRHLRHFREFAERADRETFDADPVRTLRRVREEYSNVRAALDWAMAAPRNAEDGLRLACGLRWLWRLEGDYIDSRERLTQALRRAAGAPPELVARARIALGLILHHRAEFAAARMAIEQGLAELPPDERWERAFGTVLLSFNDTMDGRLDRAESLAKTAAALVAPLEDDRLIGFALIRDGVAAGLVGNYQAAMDRLTDACRRLRLARDPFLLAYGAVNLGLQRYLAADPSGSRAAFLETVTTASAVDNLRAIGGAVEGLAYLAIDAGDPRWGARLLGTAERVRETTAAPLLPQWRAAHDRAVLAIEERLGPFLAARERRAGAETPLPDIVQALLREEPTGQ